MANQKNINVLLRRIVVLFFNMIHRSLTIHSPNPGHASALRVCLFVAHRLCAVRARTCVCLFSCLLLVCCGSLSTTHTYSDDRRRLASVQASTATCSTPTHHTHKQPIDLAGLLHGLRLTSFLAGLLPAGLLPALCAAGLLSCWPPSWLDGLRLASWLDSLLVCWPPGLLACWPPGLLAGLLPYLAGLLSAGLRLADWMALADTARARNLSENLIGASSARQRPC